jgi:hypothetical protein
LCAVKNAIISLRRTDLEPDDEIMVIELRTNKSEKKCSNVDHQMVMLGNLLIILTQLWSNCISLLNNSLLLEILICQI